MRVLDFGKHAGKALKEVEQGYLRWMVGSMGSSRWGEMAKEELDKRGAVNQVSIKDVVVPFGKYKGKLLIDVDDSYLRWMHKELPLEWGDRTVKALKYRSRMAARGDKEQIEGDDDQEEDTDFLQLLKTCKTLEVARKLHRQVCDSQLKPAARLFFLNLLIETYGNCGATGDAVQLFRSMEVVKTIDSTSWKSIIKVCLDSGCLHQAQEIFDSMPDDVAADPQLLVTCTVMVAARGAAGLPSQARVAFDRIGVPDVVAWNAILSCYTNNGNLKEAKAIFDKIPSKDAVSWNALVAGFIHHHEHDEEARISLALLPAFDHVSLDLKFQHTASSAPPKQVKLSFDAVPARRIVTWTNLIKAYSSHNLLEEAGITFNKMPMHNMVSGIASICCSIGVVEAKSRFDAMQEHNVRSWTSILAAYGAERLTRDMIDTFNKMPQHDVSSCNVALFGYAAVGHLEEAVSLFLKMPQRDNWSWLSIFSGFAIDGRADEAIELLRLMSLEGFEADGNCFTQVLVACSHVRRVKDGRHHFLMMTQNHGIQPGIEHYSSVVDMLARAGKLDEAEELVQYMPFLPNNATLHALAGACRSQNDHKRLERVFSLALEMDEANAASYVLLANVYGGLGEGDKVKMVKKQMRERGMKRIPGVSTVRVKNKVHTFVVGNKSHPQIQEIHAELERLNALLRKEGYTPNTNITLHDGNEEEKQEMLCRHSEKLALAFGLISTKDDEVVEITKNLRMCYNCHDATRFVSKIVGRKIVVRDASRIHRFEHGICSCWNIM